MKQIIKEESVQTVNDVQLKDLFDAACKTEQQIINLAVASMSFSNPEIKKAVTALKSQASQLTQLIGGAMQVDANINLGSEEKKQSLDAPNPADQIIESLLMKSLNLTQKQAQTLVETFDFKRDVLDKKNDEKDAKGEKDEENNDEKKIEEGEEMSDAPIVETIDLKEAFKMISEKGLSSDKFDTFKTKVVKTLTESKGSYKSSIYLMIEDEIQKSTNIGELNEGFNKLYDFADEKNIIITTA